MFSARPGRAIRQMDTGVFLQLHPATLQIFFERPLAAFDAFSLVFEPFQEFEGVVLKRGIREFIPTLTEILALHLARSFVGVCDTSLPPT